MTFESTYYEDEAFWANGMVEDAANLKRLRSTVEMLPESTSSVLDVGCGNGVFATLLKRARPHVRITCVDRSAAALAHVHADEKFQCEASQLPFEDKSSDCVTCLEVIEHLSIVDFGRCLSELARVASQSIVISVPYNEAIERNTDTCPSCKTVFNRDLHLRSFSPEGFERLLAEYGFVLKAKVHPVPNSHYLGFRTYYRTRRFLAGEYKRGNEFLSPICPLCGYERPRNGETAVAPQPAAPAQLPAKNKSSVKELVKALWPKQVTPGYWIIGLFVRED